MCDGSPSAAKERADSGVNPFGKAVIRRLFTLRHESPYLRDIARQSMRHARLARDRRRDRGR